MARTRPRSRRSSALYCGWPFSWSVSPSSGVLASMTAASSRAAALRAARPATGSLPALFSRSPGIACHDFAPLTTTGPLGPVGLRPQGLDFGLSRLLRLLWAVRLLPRARRLLLVCLRHRGARRGRSASVVPPAAGRLARHRFQGGDAVVGARVGGKQTVHALAGKRIDDEEVGSRRIALGIRIADAFGAAGDLVKGRRKPERVADRFRRRAGRPRIRGCG